MTRLAAALLLAAAACGSNPPGGAPAQAGASPGGSDAPAARVVDGGTAAALAAAGARVVDVRTPREFAAGHVPGAVNVPYDELPRRAAEIGGPETPVVLYCRSGRRSAIAADALRKLGYTQVWDAQRYDRWPATGG